MATKVPIVLGTYRIPVHVKTAVKEEKDTELHQVCTGGDPVIEDGKPVVDTEGEPVLTVHDPVRIKQEQSCPTCLRVQKANTWKRASDNGDGTFTVLTEEEFAAANGVEHDITHTITLTTHATEKVDRQTLPGGKFYWLEPDAIGVKDYALLVRALTLHPELAFCTVWAYRTAPAMYRLVVHSGVLALQQIAWPSQVQPAPVLNVEPDARWVPVMEQILEILTDDFDPSTFVDTRKVKLAQALAATQPQNAGEGETVTDAAPAVEAVNPLLAALEAMRAAKGITAEPVAAPKKRAKKKIDPKATPPVQPLPEQVPDNVTVVTPTPAKRPSRKKVSA